MAAWWGSGAVGLTMAAGLPETRPLPGQIQSIQGHRHHGVSRISGKFNAASPNASFTATGGGSHEQGDVNWQTR